MFKIIYLSITKHTIPIHTHSKNHILRFPGLSKAIVNYDFVFLFKYII